MFQEELIKRMKNWVIREDELDEVFPPRTRNPFSGAILPPEQVELLNRHLDSSELVSGAPCTGKTVLALLRAKRLVDEGKKCLYVAGTSLALKYVKHAATALGIYGLRCAAFYDVTKESARYDVIFLDDSHRYSLHQIQTLQSLTQYLLLFGDYSGNPICRREDSATIDEISKAISGCRFYSLHSPFGVPNECLRLASRFNHVVPLTSVRWRLPVIARMGSIEDQCLSVQQLVKAHEYDNVGVLCYTRNLVKEALDSFIKLGMIIEGYLPGREDGLDTWNPGSSIPKLTTIASAYGIHFNTVFVIGFDSRIVWNNPETVIETAVTRATDNLFIFYDKKLPEPLDSIPQSYYRTGLHNSIEF